MLLTRMTTATTLLCAATKWEAEPLARTLGLERRTETFYGGGKLALLKTGAGAENVARSLSSLDAVVSIWSVGLCGALQPGMATGDIVFDVQGAPSEWPPLARETAQELGLRIHFGRIADAPRVLAPVEKAELGAKLRAGAVDMETAAVRAWAAERGAECYAARAVLDAVDEAVPSEIPASESPAALLAYAARHMGSLPLLLATGLKSRKAMANLSLFLKGFLR